MGLARPKYQVFVSSTYADLHEEREAIIWAILTARHIPVGMEAFTATDDRGWQTIKSVIDRTDYYVLVIAGRYGSIDDNGISWTEREYEYAIERKIPAMVFIRSKASITAINLEDNHSLAKKLESFKKRVKERHHCIEWATKEDLVTCVSNALRNHILDDEDSGAARPGWYRGDELPKAATLDEFARLSTEAAQLKSELDSLRAGMEDAKYLALVNQDQTPIDERHKTARVLKINEPNLTSIDNMKYAVDRATPDGGKFLVLNSISILEFGVKNTGNKLVEYVTVDITLNPIEGFYCGSWGGRDFYERKLLLSNLGERSSTGDYPESARLSTNGKVVLRFKIDRISIGATEYLRPILVVGSVDNTHVFFSIDYTISGSIGAVVSGRSEYEIEFNGSKLVDRNTYFDESALFRRINRPSDLGSMLLSR